MKIIYHHRIISDDGQAVHIREMVNALRRRGHQVFIIGSTVNRNKTNNHLPIFSYFRRFCPKWLYEVLEIMYNLTIFYRINRAIYKIKPDFIYERYNLFLFAGIWASRWHRLPLLLEVNAPLAEERALHALHGSGLALQYFADWSERWVWCAADRVFTVTRVLADRITDAGVERQRIVVTPNGVDLRRFQALPSRIEAKAALNLAGKTIVGFVGFVRTWHGLDVVVDWLAEKAPSNAILLLVGDGPARQELVARALEFGVADRLIITGVVEPTQIPSFLASFDVALQPAVVPYASPLKIFEYMAAGCAILAPNTPNIREILRHKCNAILFEPGEIGTHLSNLVSNSGISDGLGNRAKIALSKKYLSWDNNAFIVERVVWRTFLK